MKQIINTPLVSVILPTYNRTDHLTGAISSVVAQTYPHWELIIWDDGSTDNSEEVVKSFSDRRITYFKENNRGVAYARNQAINRSSGEFIAFLDSDDTWIGEKLQVQVDALTKYQDIDFLFADFQNSNETEKTPVSGFSQHKESMAQLITTSLGDNLYLVNNRMAEAICRSNFIATDTVIVKRTCVIHVGLFNEELRNSEDFEYWWRICLHDYRFAYFEKALLIRNKLEDGLSNNNVENCQNKLKALDSCKQIATIFCREDLVKLLRNSYRRLWLRFLRLYSQFGDRKKALKAFIEVCKYGFSIRALYLLLGGLTGNGWTKSK